MIFKTEKKEKMRGPAWYGYSRNQALDVISLPKIFTPDIAASSSFSFNKTGKAFFTGGAAGGYGILVLPSHSPQYILGLLNCTLLEWVIRNSATHMRSGYFSYESRFIRSLPIRIVNFSVPADKAKHDDMVSLVDRMLDLYKGLADTAALADRERLQRQIDSTDRQINSLAYDLYGLTKEEIKIVEGTPVASETAACENVDDESSGSSPSESPGVRRQATRVAETARYAGEGGGGAPESFTGARDPIHGVREPAGKYGPPQTLLKNPQKQGN